MCTMFLLFKYFCFEMSFFLSGQGLLKLSFPVDKTSHPATAMWKITSLVFRWPNLDHTHYPEAFPTIFPFVVTKLVKYSENLAFAPLNLQSAAERLLSESILNSFLSLFYTLGREAGQSNAHPITTTSCFIRPFVLYRHACPFTSWAKASKASAGITLRKLPFNSLFQQYLKQWPTVQDQWCDLFGMLL